MNSIILNGKRSADVRGLLIQSLPPISKPLMRTSIEQIDGRDGDIVTKLGYAAYDKQISVGLHKDFDIDAVIEYFDSEGTVIFSNEPDKYYNYHILNQIDFARLIRYRTADITMHCQPFKYSAVEKTVSFDISEFLTFDDYTETKNGLTLTAENGVISISGTATETTEFYMPINTVSLSAGSYSFNAYAHGTSPDSASIRLINEVPSDAESFGGTYVTLQDDTTVSLTQELSAAKSYNYIWFHIAAETMNFSLYAGVTDNTKSVNITNTGNIVSKPKMTIHGNGTINLSLNGNQIFVIYLGAEESITIDSAQMEAYKDGILKNRLVVGDYDNLALKIGKNTLTWSGNVTKLEIENYSRWI